MERLIKVWQIGRINYGKSLKLQKYLVNFHHQHKDAANTLLFLEHPPVYTTGIRTKIYSEQEEAKLRSVGKFVEFLRLKFYYNCLLLI